MVRFYWYGLTVIYLACIAAGMLFGSVWGTAGMIVGIAFGATAAAGFAMFADKSEGRENAFYAFSPSCSSSRGLAWFIVTYSSAQP
jgi:hypothetical protein